MTFSNFYSAVNVAGQIDLMRRAQFVRRCLTNWIDNILAPVDAQILASRRRIVARDYRNRRIGDFLKELDLTEGRGTGFPTIYRVMENNGSPLPIFDTDTQSTYFLATLPAHELAASVQQSVQQNVQQSKSDIRSSGELAEWIKLADPHTPGRTNDQIKNLIKTHISDYAIQIMSTLIPFPRSRKALLEAIGLSNHTKNKERHIDPLIQIGWIAYTIPENPNHRSQKYKLTLTGRHALELIDADPRE